MGVLNSWLCSHRLTFASWYCGLPGLPELTENDQVPVGAVKVIYFPTLLGRDLYLDILNLFYCDAIFRPCGLRKD